MHGKRRPDQSTSGVRSGKRLWRKCSAKPSRSGFLRNRSNQHDVFGGESRRTSLTVLMVGWHGPTRFGDRDKLLGRVNHPERVKTMPSRTWP